MRFNADLYRIVAGFQATEGSRYYLCGVFVEPCAVGGVTLTATDGHRLLCVRDETGQADQSGIVALSKDAMKLCKSKLCELRRVTVDGLNATVECERAGNVDPETAEWEAIGISQKVFVDGTFPDYRRVIPQAVVTDPTKAHSWFCGWQAASFANAAAELEKQANQLDKGAVCYCSSDSNSPSLVLFSNSPHAFGVLMPVRGGDLRKPPAWFFGETALDKAAE